MSERILDRLKKARETGELPQTLEDLVAAYRQDQGVSRSEALRRLGAAAGIQPGTVGQIIRGGIKRPPDVRLEGFARVLGDITRGEDVAQGPLDGLRPLTFEQVWAHLLEIIGEGIEIRTLKQQAPNRVRPIGGGIEITTDQGKDTLPREWFERTWNLLAAGPVSEPRLSPPERYRASGILAILALLPYVDYSTYPRITVFQVSHIFSNSDIAATFGVSQQGGIRFSGEARRPRHVIFITDRLETTERNHPYRDRWHDGAFYYTGEGRLGDQRLTRGNLALQVSSEVRCPVYGFEKQGPDRYAYLGRFEVVGVDQEEQEDTQGTLRKVYVFRMKPTSDKEAQVVNSWIFQVNPALYDIRAALGKLNEVTLLVRQHRQRIRPGDVVYIWETLSDVGEDSGIIAVARVIAPPAEIPMDPRELEFARDESTVGGVQTRARLALTGVLKEKITRATLQEHPILKSLTLLRVRQGSNFPLTEEQARALEELIGTIGWESGPAEASPDRHVDHEGVAVTQQGERPPQANAATIPVPAIVTFDVEALPAGWEWQRQLDRLITRVAATGFNFEPWQIAAYVTALRTKPFVILAGISGTGKSRLPQIVADAVGYRCELVPVRPDWTDSSDLLGYTDLQGHFRPGKLLQVAEQASSDLAQGYVIVLDEMNLARVEHYFAEVLSRIEDRAADGSRWSCKPLLILPDEAERDPDRRRWLDRWAKVALPPNLAVVGTVNMDESTHGFSRKVLDRAFTLELSDVDLSRWGAAAQGAEESHSLEWPASALIPRRTSLARAVLSDREEETVRGVISVLEQLNEQLRLAQLQVGYRVRDEIALFVLNASECEASFVTQAGGRVDPLDLAVSMKVLPRIIGGSGAVRRVLRGILAWAIGGRQQSSGRRSADGLSDDDADQLVDGWRSAGRPQRLEDAEYPLCAARACIMWERLMDDGFTSFWL